MYRIIEIVGNYEIRRYKSGYYVVVSQTGITRSGAIQSFDYARKVAEAFAADESELGVKAQ